MNDSTRLATARSEVWEAKCPKCSRTSERENLKCENCDSFCNTFVTEVHEVVRHRFNESENSAIFPNESYLQCDKCHQKLKSIICPLCEDCVLSIPNVRVLLHDPIHPPRRKRGSFASGCFLYVILFFATVILFEEVGLSRFIETKERPHSYLSNALLLVAYGLPLVLTLWARKRLFNRKPTKTRWYRFDK